MSTAHTYPLEDWRITETAFDAESNLLDETLFALGNGYIGQRGTLEEGFGGSPKQTLEGTYLNGFYETEPIRYPETAYGLAKQNQFMLNVPNGKRIELFVGDERFDLLQGQVARYERTLDFRTGVLTRSVEWVSPQGKRVDVRIERLVCLQRKHVFAIRYQVKPLNFSGRIVLASAIDGRVKNLEAGDDPRVGSNVSAPPLQWVNAQQSDSGSQLVYRTRHSGFTLVSAIEHELLGDAPFGVERVRSEDQQSLGHRYIVSATEGQAIELVKFGAYHTSRDYPEAELGQRSKDTLEQARAAGFDFLCREQADFLGGFWRDADIEIAGDAALQQGIRFNEFHLLQSVGRDGRTNIAAKGVTGEGYEGHYFWDTEIYVFPFFLATRPEVARQLLAYRYAGLPSARERAREMSHAKGALYPWRTIAGGECSAYFPAGTAQYHINADIAHSVKSYYEATGDEDFLAQQGAEIVMETARIWLGLGSHDPRRGGAFCIHEVTGPDEYTAMVSNNFYTNAMAQQHLAFAAQVARKLQQDKPADFQRIAEAMELDAAEPAQWQKAADAMYLPLDPQLGIHPQDDTFLDKPVWDFENTPADKYPLLLNYHPLVIYRHQVCKQADVVLALLLRGDRFSHEEKRRDYDYYEPITTHDSSLSAGIFSIIAAEVGYAEKAYAYFMETARMDLDNNHGNTQYGVHTAAMAGTWLGLVYGFGGMRLYDGVLHFAPTLPQQWQHYQFKVRVRGSQLQVRVGRGEAEYRLVGGESLEFHHQGRPVRLSAAEPMQTLALKG